MIQFKIFRSVAQQTALQFLAIISNESFFYEIFVGEINSRNSTNNPPSLVWVFML